MAVVAHRPAPDIPSPHVAARVRAMLADPTYKATFVRIVAHSEGGWPAFAEHALPSWDCRSLSYRVVLGGKGSRAISCTCPAGEHGVECSHRVYLEILWGSRDACTLEALPREADAVHIAPVPPRRDDGLAIHARTTAGQLYQAEAV